MIMILSKQGLKKYISRKPYAYVNVWLGMYWYWSWKLNTEPMVLPIILQRVLNADHIRIFTKEAEILQCTFNNLLLILQIQITFKVTQIKIY